MAYGWLTAMREEIMPKKEMVYDLRVPTASSIYPQLTRGETLSVLLDANESRPIHKRFPIDILLLVIDELYPPNPVYEKIRSIWTTDTSFERSRHYQGKHLDEVLFNADTKTFYIPKQPFPEASHNRQQRELDESMSSADLLYRIRCLFPEISVESAGRYAYTWTWATAVRHKKTGINIEFSENRGGAIMNAICREMLYDCPHNSGEGSDYDGGATVVPLSKEEANNVFTTDAIQLLNMLFGTIDGKRFIYYHPAADADYPTTEECFLASPRRRRIPEEEENLIPYHRWCPVWISPSDLSSFKSILPDLKYNIESRKVDPVNGTADLTTVLSSSLLFYRLLCHYIWKDNNVNIAPPITSVWQVKLRHIPNDFPFYDPPRNGPSIIFMDNRGLFDIRAEGIDAVIDDLVDLVDDLFSDECCHPYDGLVAGYVA
ncbi:hypothetical protein Clacol_001030 [Clathrus columnatus]|uniref:Uncharacterized protein n=1 Tax=Clathrus columnatus TaxID=1419009 RepID=A0AAV5A270_9AGAM|nr:hypothetical protein Clacol_001030 [Clathrus columnatus]